MKKSTPLAIAYDFDGTLAPGNIQERNFIPALNITPKAFWKEVSDTAKDHKGDNILIYMQLMLEKAQAAKVQVRLEDFRNHGKDLRFFDGILPNRKSGDHGWFDRINEFGRESNLDIQHYVVSSGIREMVEGTPIAKKFAAVFASSFFYDHHGVAVWPALALNYTTKTQYLFRINKGCLDVYDHGDINRFIPETSRPIPFKHMIYVGDGETDIPCFRVVKDRGGHSIAVFKPRTRGAQAKSVRLLNDGRVNFVAPADYQEGGRLDQIIKALIDKVAADRFVEDLAVKSSSSFSRAKRPRPPSRTVGAAVPAIAAPLANVGAVDVSALSTSHALPEESA